MEVDMLVRNMFSTKFSTILKNSDIVDSSVRGKQ